MKILVIGGGWYGCHLATVLLDAGHEVTLTEKSDRLFAGASGGNPARLHLGFHYPRSRLTRVACQEHNKAFLRVYGNLTKGIPVNIYAVADRDSFVDFGTYKQLLRSEVDLIEIYDTKELGLQNVEGAVLTGERHIVIDKVRKLFENKLNGHVQFNTIPSKVYRDTFDFEIDCTFCANDGVNIDRFEPCVTHILEGPIDTAVTIMDGPFPSVYPWNEEQGLSSLTSAKWTPLSKTCKTYDEARDIIDRFTIDKLRNVGLEMFEQMRMFYPLIEEYEIIDHITSIRAMPRSGADARLVDVIETGERSIRIRAGKIDAIVYAEQLVMERLRVASNRH